MTHNKTHNGVSRAPCVVSSVVSFLRFFAPFCRFGYNTDAQNIA